jgi:hypothetical protein
MTPADKAKELVDKFKHNTRAFNETNGWEDTLHDAKQCALIAVDEVVAFIDEHMQGWLDWDWKSYWEQVKIEIEKI